MKHLQAVKTETALRAGSSRPLVVAGDDGERYIVKLTGSGASHNSGIIETLSARMGREFFNIPVLETVIVRIDDSLINAIPDSELQDSINKSYGDNPAYRFYEGAVNIPFNELDACREITDLVFMYDLFLMNVDRNIYNTNMLRINGNVVSIDYESSFLIKGILENKNYANNEQVIKSLRSSPLYSDKCNIENFIMRMNNIDEHHIAVLVNELPESWLDKKSKKALSMKIFKYITDAAHLPEIYRRVKSTSVDSEELKQTERLKRRDAFICRLNNE